MKKVKIFYDHEIERLEEKINAFTNKNNIETIDIKYVMCYNPEKEDTDLSAMITYKNLED